MIESHVKCEDKPHGVFLGPICRLEASPRLMAGRLSGVGGDVKCARCEKIGSECVRFGRRLKFLHTISSATG